MMSTCNVCEVEIENENDWYSCDGCTKSYHIGCDGVTKKEISARKSSNRLRLLCNSCVTDTNTITADNVKLILQYVQKIDLEVQKQKTNESVYKKSLSDIMAKCDRIKSDMNAAGSNKSIQTGTNDGAKTFATVLKETKKPVIIVKPKDGKQKSSDTAAAIKSKIDYKDINSHGIKNVRNGGIAIQCESSGDTLKISQMVQKELGANYEVQLPEIKKPRVIIRRVFDDIDDEHLVDEIKHQNEPLKDAELSIKKVIRRKGKNLPFDIAMEVDFMSII